MPARAALVVVNGRLDLERELVAAVCVGGAPVLLTLRSSTPWTLAWMTRPLREAVEAAEYLARQGRDAPFSPEDVSAEVRRCGGGEDLAAAVRETVADAVEAYGGRDVAELGRIGRLADALADAAAGDGDQPDDGLPIRLLPASRLLDTAFPPVAYAVEPYFPRGEVTELVGAHGLFKSTLALGACLSVSSGRSWGGATVAQGKTVFVTMEDAERTLSRRVKAWLDGLPPGRERSDAEADIREHFSYLGREGARELALTSSDRHSTAIRGSVVECVTELVRGATLVVLETASRLHEGPEQNEALAVFAQAVERIATESGAAVVVVRHVSKQAAREQIVDSYAGRGGGSLSDAARSVLVVTLDRRPGEDEDDGTVPTPVRVTHAKSTLSARGAPLLWLPVVAEHGVYLRSLSAADETRADAQRLHVALLEAAGEGLTRRALRNEKPAGLGSVKAERAIAHLVQTGRAISTTENRPRNPGVVVYRAAQAVREEP